MADDTPQTPDEPEDEPREESVDAAPGEVIAGEGEPVDDEEAERRREELEAQLDSILGAPEIVDQETDPGADEAPAVEPVEAETDADSGAPDEPPSTGDRLDQATIDMLLQQSHEEPPLAFAESSLVATHEEPFVRRPSSASVQRVGDLDLLADVVLVVSAEIGRADMTLEEVLKLRPGSLIELDKLAGEPVELFVNDRCIARGEVVVVDDNFGIRITELGPPE